MKTVQFTQDEVEWLEAAARRASVDTVVGAEDALVALADKLAAVARQPPVATDDDLCLGCEQRTRRTEGEPVSRVEGWTGKLLYCEECAAECDAGLWDVDPDEAA